MGDRTYTRFTIPRRFLVSPARLEVVAQVAELSVEALASLLMGPPEDGPSAYANDTTLRLVQRTTCVVIEDESWNYAGSSAEQDLVAARIPFLRISAPGVSYGATTSVFMGHGEPVTLYVSDESADEVLVPMNIRADRAILHRSWFQAASRFARLRHRLFSQF